MYTDKPLNRDELPLGPYTFHPELVPTPFVGTDYETTIKLTIPYRKEMFRFIGQYVTNEYPSNYRVSMFFNYYVHGAITGSGEFLVRKKVVAITSKVPVIYISTEAAKDIELNGFPNPAPIPNRPTYIKHVCTQRLKVPKDVLDSYEPLSRWMYSSNVRSNKYALAIEHSIRSRS